MLKGRVEVLFDLFILLINLSSSRNSRELVPNCIDGNYVVEVRGKKTCNILI